MSDQELRELERRVSQGDPGARDALLRHRMRHGDLNEDRVRVAAYLGDEGSRLVLGGVWDFPPTITAWLAVLRSLATWEPQKAGCEECKDGVTEAWVQHKAIRQSCRTCRLRGYAPSEIMVRAVVATAKLILPGWEEDHTIFNTAHWTGHGAPGGWREQECCWAPRKTIEAAEEWIECQSDKQRENWWQAWHGCEAEWAPRPGRGVTRADNVGPIEAASRELGNSKTRNVIRHTLVPWLLM